MSTVLQLLSKLLLIAILVYSGVSIWYGRLEEQLQEKFVMSKDVVARPQVESEQVVVQQLDYQVIVERNIFKAALDVVAKQPEEEPVVAENLEETKLQLVLLGTVYGNERDARAIIIDKKENKQDIFQIGDALQGAFITKIERGKIILEVNGHDEVLNIKDREGGGPGAPEAPPAKSNVSSKSAVERKVPVARPRRRISIRNTQKTQVQPEQPQGEASVEEPKEPLAAEEVVTEPVETNEDRDDNEQPQ